MIHVGDTPAAVAEYLDRFPWADRRLNSLPDPVSSFERAHFGTECPKCGALMTLCYSPTGLPASSPHIERTLAAFFSDQFLEPIFDDHD